MAHIGQGCHQSVLFIDTIWCRKKYEYINASSIESNLIGCLSTCYARHWTWACLSFSNQSNATKKRAVIGAQAHGGQIRGSSTIFIGFKLNGKMSLNRQTMEIACFPFIRCRVHYQSNTMCALCDDMLECIQLKCAAAAAAITVCVCVRMKYSLASHPVTQYANIRLCTLTKSLLLCWMSLSSTSTSSSSFDIIIDSIMHVIKSYQRSGRGEEGGRWWMFSAVRLFNEAFVNGKDKIKKKICFICSVLHYLLVVYVFMNGSYAFPALNGEYMWILAQAFNRFYWLLHVRYCIRYVQTKVCVCLCVALRWIVMRIESKMCAMTMSEDDTYVRMYIN